MNIYLVRHGETDWNRQNRLQGIEDIELNETGIRQSAECAEVFTPITIDRVITSPLKRAKKTADIIVGHLGAAPAVVEQALTERDFGKLSGLTPEERRAFTDSKKDTCAEPIEALIKRFVSVLTRYAQQTALKNIVVVSHGASINAALFHVSGGSIGTGKTILKNTCISKLICTGGRMEIDFYNLTPVEVKKIGVL